MSKALVSWLTAEPRASLGLTRPMHTLLSSYTHLSSPTLLSSHTLKGTRTTHLLKTGPGLPL